MRQLSDNTFSGCDHSFHGATARKIDEWESISDEIIAHMHDIRLRKEDHAVAIRMPAWTMENSNILAVQVNGHILTEGEYGQCFIDHGLDRLLDGGEIAGSAAGLQSFADVMMCNHWSIFLKAGIPVDVVEVVMGVDDEAD